MKRTPLLLFLLVGLFLTNESCYKSDQPNYNPYTIAETDTENELTEKEIDQRFAKQMINTSSILPELINVTLHAAVEALLLDSLGGTQVAEVRTGCPCIDYVPDAITDGGVLTLTFDDGGGNCEAPGVGLLPKVYSGRIEIEFDNDPNVIDNTFSLSLIDFHIGDYNISFVDGAAWEFTWGFRDDFTWVLQEIFFMAVSKFLCMWSIPKLVL